MVPKHKYILDTQDKIPVVTRSSLRKYHPKHEVLDFIYSLWGTKETRLEDTGEQCFEASKYEEWLDKHSARVSDLSLT